MNNTLGVFILWFAWQTPRKCYEEFIVRGDEWQEKQ